MLVVVSLLSVAFGMSVVECGGDRGGIGQFEGVHLGRQLAFAAAVGLFHNRLDRARGLAGLAVTMSVLLDTSGLTMACGAMGLMEVLSAVGFAHFRR